MTVDLKAAQAKPEAERTQEEKDALAAEAKKSESPEHMIPKSRLDDVIKERDDARKAAEDLRKTQQEAADKALQEQGKWRELAEARQKELDELKPKAGLVDSYEKSLQETLNAQLKELPAEFQKLVPEELTTQQKLNWLSRNKATLIKPVAQDIGAGPRGSGSGAQKVELTDEQRAMARSYDMTDEEYAEFEQGVPEQPFNSKQTAKK